MVARNKSNADATSGNNPHNYPNANYSNIYNQNIPNNAGNTAHTHIPQFYHGVHNPTYFIPTIGNTSPKTPDAQQNQQNLYNQQDKKKSRCTIL